jgi:hypothetical protein
LETDASSIGLGAILRQGGKPVCYASRSLSGSEKNYGITEREVLVSLWGMEKFRYILCGKKFVLITDHKAIEELKRKKEFGSSRIIQWFKRLENFEFDVKYRNGTSLVVSDALSRSVKINAINDEQNVEEAIMKLHGQLNHGRNIYKESIDAKLNVSKSCIRKVLKRCVICKKNDKQVIRTCQYIETTRPGERIGVDMLEISPTCRIVMAIDYFSRKLFARVLSTKESRKILKFLKELYCKFPFESIVSDNGREFKNKSIEEWTQS